MQQDYTEYDFSLKKLFVPLTTFKAIHFIAIIGFIVFFNSLFNGFVWDDLPQYINKPITHSLLSISQILADKTTTFYRPFPTIVFASIYSIFGETAFWYHLSQLILHITNTVLVFLLMKKFVSNTNSFFLSLIFLIHPMNVESVAYISTMQTVLSLFFGLLALILIGNKRHAFFYKYSMIFFLLLLSVLSKETGWVFFVLIPSFMALNKINNFHWKDYISFALSCFFVSAIYFSIILASPTKVGDLIAPIPILHAPLLVRLLTLPKIIFYYLYTFIYPINLGVTQQWLVTKMTLQDFIFPLTVDVLFFLCILAAGVYVAKRNNKMTAPYLFFTIWFLLSFVFFWQLFPLEMTVADRWFYFPIIGLLGMSSIIMNSIRIKHSLFKYFLICMVTFLIIGYSIRTVIRVRDWKDGITLFSHDRTVSYQSYDLYNNLGYNYLLLQRYDEAKPFLEESIRLAPGSWESWLNLGTYYGNTGKLEKAVKAFSTAIEINKNYYPAYLNITRVYYYDNKLSEANNFLATKALVKYPGDPYFWSVKGAVDYRLGKKQQGMEEVRKAYDLSKNTFYLSMYNLMQNNQDISSLR